MTKRKRRGARKRERRVRRLVEEQLRTRQINIQTLSWQTYTDTLKPPRPMHFSANATLTHPNRISNHKQQR